MALKFQMKHATGPAALKQAAETLQSELITCKAAIGNHDWKGVLDSLEAQKTLLFGIRGLARGVIYAELTPSSS